MFAESCDRLWLAAALDPGRLSDALPRPALEHGQRTRLPASDTTLYWAASEAPGESPSDFITESAVETGLVASEPRLALPDLAVRPFGLSALRERLWALSSEPRSPRLAARASDRRLALALAESLAVAPAGCAVLPTREHLARHLERRAERDETGPWVVKAVLSAAGRHRVFGGLGARPDPDDHALDGLFARGPVVFEPWEDRVADFGLRLWIDADGARLLGAHRLEVDARGTFRGIGVEAPTGDGLARCLGSTDASAESDRERVARVVARVGRELAVRGYRGPVGVDGRRVVQGDRTVLRPLGEINPRLTFGFVAAAIAEHLMASGRLDQVEGSLGAIVSGATGASTRARPGGEGSTRPPIELLRAGTGRRSLAIAYSAPSGEK